MKTNTTISDGPVHNSKINRTIAFSIVLIVGLATTAFVTTTKNMCVEQPRTVMARNDGGATVVASSSTEGVQRGTEEAASAGDKRINPTLPVEDSDCTIEQGRYQAEKFCPSYWNSRHNIKDFFTIVRIHLPDARLLVDVGANKGLVSARWLELWKPELNMYPNLYAQNVVRTYFDRHNHTEERQCGVTPFCDAVNDVERKLLRMIPPSPQKTADTEGADLGPFEIHSFEPSIFLIEMHREYIQQFNSQSSTAAADKNGVSSSIGTFWKWHSDVVSNKIEEIYFDSVWHEGSKLSTTGTSRERNEHVVDTRTSISLDSLATYSVPSSLSLNDYEDMITTAEGTGKILANRIIDMIKIDAESVDLPVVSGASRLLADNRIRVIIWESPNTFPVTFPHFGTGGVIVKSYNELVDAMDEYARMSCYIPGKGNVSLKLTSTCWKYYSQYYDSSAEGGCDAMHSNIACVHRTLAPSLYKALELNSLSNIYSHIEAKQGIL